MSELRGIRLQVVVQEANEGEELRLVVLVNGQNVLGHVGDTYYIGFPPREILRRDDPLLPTDPPLQVAVYRCTCGLPWDAVVAPVISRQGDEVVWSDFRDYSGVFEAPTTNVDFDDVEPWEQRALDLPTLRFNADQYETEVRRARNE